MLCYNVFMGKSIHKSVRIPEEIVEIIQTRAEFMDRSFNYVLVELLKKAVAKDERK